MWANKSSNDNIWMMMKMGWDITLNDLQSTLWHRNFIFTNSSSSLCKGLPSLTAHSCSPLRYSHKPSNPLPEPLIFLLSKCFNYRLLNKQSKFYLFTLAKRNRFFFSLLFLHLQTHSFSILQSLLCFHTTNACKQIMQRSGL